MIVPTIRKLIRPLVLCILFAVIAAQIGFSRLTPARASGVNWPSTQMFPSFSSFTALDVIDLSGLSGDRQTLFTTLEGLINRTQTRVYALDNFGEGKTYWLDKMVSSGVARNNVADPFSLITKYRSEIAGIIIYDPNQMDTVNLANTIAGVKGAVVVSPALAGTLNAAPYSLPTLVDLRTANGGGAFTSTLQVYQYAHDNYWSQTSHRIFFGLQTDRTDVLRDYVVATMGMVVWLNPADSSQLALLNSFWSDMPPASPYVGWWPDEPVGVNAASAKGLITFAADWLSNASVFGGTSRTITPKAIPATPALQNKIYVQLVMSDGDNVQENQHLTPIKWADPNRGNVPLTWTLSPADVDLQPFMLNYFYSIATANDVLISGPSGLGYTYPSTWATDWLTRYARMSNSYMNAAGMRIITLWNNGAAASNTVQSIYAQEMPTLLGMTLQDGPAGVSSVWNGTLPTIVMNHGYATTQADIENTINNAVSAWNGTQPLFVSIQGDLNIGVITPSLMYQVKQDYASNANIVFVRGDHFFQLMRQTVGLPTNPPAYQYEAESTANTLVGGAAIASCNTASGGQIVRNTSGSSAIQFNQINVASAGYYRLSINYFNGDAATLPTLMSVNSNPATTLNFTSQSIGWCDQGKYLEGMFTTMVKLNAGNNTIKFWSPNTGYAPDYDSISLAPAIGQTGYWALDDGSGTTAMDSSGHGHNGALNGAPTWTSGNVNGALNLNGSSDYVAINNGVVNTLGSYSVSAWVQLSNAGSGNYYTAVSQDGTTISGFFLQYSAALGNKFAWSLLNSDSIGAAVTRAISVTTPGVGTWYHIVGVRDADANQIRLYVNGALEATQSFTGAWSATGNLAFGRSKWAGTNADFWPGKIDEVHTFDYALSDSEIASLYNVSTSAVATPTPSNTPNPDGSPYSGTPYAIPGQVEVENYNLGGEGIAYHDADTTNNGGQYRPSDGVDIETTTDTNGGYNIGWTANGEWTKYSVNVTTTGKYNFTFRVASAVAGGSIHLEVDNVNVTGSLTVPNTGGWQTWTSVPANNISLSAGSHIFKLFTDVTGGNYNWFSAALAASSTNTPTFVPATNTPGATATRTPTFVPPTVTSQPKTATPTATPTSSVSTSIFSTGLESGQPQPTWINTVETVNGGISNVGGICCGLTGPELGTRTETTHTGTVSLMYSGLDNSATSSYAYIEVFNVGTGTLSSTSQLSYWIYPQSSATSGLVNGNNSSCVAIDIIFTDNSNLRDSGVTDQNSNRVHPAMQCGHLTLDAWNNVTANLGSLSGKTIARINVGYDQPANTGGYRGYIDDISISK